MLALATAAAARAISRASRSRSRSAAPSNRARSAPPSVKNPVGRPRHARNRVGRSKSRANTRSPIRNDGAGNQRLSVSHGRSASRLSQRSESAIRSSLTPVDTASMVYTGTSTTAYGQCEYTCENSEVGTAADINAVMANAKNNNDSEVKPGVDGKFFMNSFDMELKIINACNSVTNIRIYEVLARRDIPIAVGDLQALCSTGWTDQAPSIGTPISKNWLGGSLYQNVGLTPFYKIIKDTRLTLAPGKELRLNLSHKTPKTMNPVVVDALNVTAIGGYTKGFVVQHWGQPIGDTPANPINQTISTSVSKILWTVTKKYKYQEQYDNAGNTFELTAPIPTVFPAPPTVLVNQLTGDLRPEVRA